MASLVKAVTALTKLKTREVKVARLLILKGEMLCIAHGVFEGYDRQGPFVANEDLDVNALMDAEIGSSADPVDVEATMRNIAARLLNRGVISELPCRNVYLGSFGEVGIKEEDLQSYGEEY